MSVCYHDQWSLLCYSGGDYIEDLPFLESVLKLSSLFSIEDGRAFAIRNIDYLRAGAVHPARKLYLAIQYNVDQWTAPSFQALLQQPVGDMDTHHVSILGMIPYHLLVVTKEEIRSLRQQCAWAVPQFHRFVLCTQPGMCESAWKREWIMGIGRVIMHPSPEEYTPLSVIHAKLADPNLTITGVCRDCLQPTVQDLLSKHILEQEAAIIEVGIKKIVDFQTDKVIRAHLSDVCSIIFGTDADGRPKAPEICPLPVSQPNK